MEIDCGLGAFFGLQKGYVLAVIHKKVLGQDSRATGVADDVEVLFDVGTRGIILPTARTWMLTVYGAGCFSHCL